MSSIHHNFARNPPKTQSGWYCQACGYFTPRLDDKERALVCRKARDTLEDVRQFLKPKEAGEMVVSGVHPHVPEPESMWQPQRCRCGGTIRTQLMGVLICGECGRTP